MNVHMSVYLVRLSQAERQTFCSCLRSSDFSENLLVNCAFLQSAFILFDSYLENLCLDLLGKSGRSLHSSSCLRMIPRRALTLLTTPNSEGSVNGNIPAKKEKNALLFPLETSHTIQAVGRNCKRSKSDSCLDHVQEKKPRLKENLVSFTIHEDVFEEKIVKKSPLKKTPKKEISLHVSVPSTSHSISSVQYSVEEQTQWMTSKTPSDSYYKVLTERCQAALNETVEENAKLRESIDVLRVENEHLYELASQAEYFADILQKQMDREEARIETGTQTD